MLDNINHNDIKHTNDGKKKEKTPSKNVHKANIFSDCYSKLNKFYTLAWNICPLFASYLQPKKKDHTCLNSVPPAFLYAGHLCPHSYAVMMFRFFKNINENRQEFYQFISKSFSGCVLITNWEIKHIWTLNKKYLWFPFKS